MKKTFMWHYSLILMILFAAYGLWEAFLWADSDAFWLFVFTAPIAIWLFTNRE